MTLAPTVSVIVPAFNRAALVEQTLDSLLAQTGGVESEIVVVDDGSTDDTAARVQRYADRVRLLHQPNQGAAAARNLGILHARGRLIALCDSDDLWPPDKLERQVALLDRHPRAGFLYGAFRCFEDSPGGGGRREWTLDQPTPAGFIFPALLERNFIVPSTALITRSAVEAIGRAFDPDCCNAEDYDFFLRLALRFEAVYDEGVSCLYRQHAVSATRQRERYWRGFLGSLEKARREVARLHEAGTLRNPVDGRPVSSGEARAWDALLRRRIASFHLRLARHWSRAGRPADAWREAADALRLAPTRSEAWSMLWKALRQRLGLRENL